MNKIIEFRPKEPGDVMDPAKDKIYKKRFIAGLNRLTFGTVCTLDAAIKQIQEMNQENPKAYLIAAYKPGAIMVNVAHETRQEYQDNRPASLFHGLSLEMWKRAKALEFNQVSALTNAIEQLAKDPGENMGIYAIKL